MRENNPFYSQYKDVNNYKPINFSVYNHLEDESFVTSLNNIYKKRYEMNDFIMKYIPLSKDDINELKDEHSILSICLKQCIRYIHEDQKGLPFPKHKCFRLGNAVVFIKLNA
jgi:hypothetical protein